MRARSIPEEHEARILRWFMAGDSYRAIADRLSGEHEVNTSPGSVQRVMDRIALGNGTDAVMRTVIKIRLNSPRLADNLQLQLAMANKLAGLNESVEIPAGVTHKEIDFANRLTHRELKVAGCVGADAERAMLRFHVLAEAACREEEATDSQRRPIQEPPPEPPRASSNGRFANASEARPVVAPFVNPAVGSGGGPPCPPRSVAAPAKQGRNEPCACGSGEKFKRCCGGPNGRPRVAPKPPALAI